MVVLLCVKFRMGLIAAGFSYGARRNCAAPGNTDTSFHVVIV
jgi:hypothetical protein